MQKFNFSNDVNRIGSFSTQWDYIADRFGSNDLLPFTISDGDFASSPAILKVLQQRIEHGVFGYSRWQHHEFKNAIVNWFSRRHNTQINAEMIVYSPTIIYSLGYLIQKFSNEGDAVLLQSPAYDAFFQTINGLNRKVLANELTYDENNQAQINFTELETLAAQARIMLICNPHNPTGRAWSEFELNKMLDIARRHKLFVISDDAHCDVVYKDKQYISIAKLWSSYENVALLASTAKGFNTASLGGSYVIFNSERIKQDFLNNLKIHGLSSAPIMFILATIAAYNDSEEWLNAFIDNSFQNLAFIEKFLKENFSIVKLYKPEASYLAWLCTKSLNLSSDKIQDRLINVGKVAIMDGKIYGAKDGEFLRLNVACSKHKVEKGMQCLLKALET